MAQVLFNPTQLADTIPKLAAANREFSVTSVGIMRRIEEELEFWCHCNCEWHYSVSWISIDSVRNLKFEFADEREAVMFKLVWG